MEVVADGLVLLCFFVRSSFLMSGGSQPDLTSGIQDAGFGIF